ncbi:MAG: M48 family metalloprotease [Gammaproteobacteria bacterium]|nr:M48 family metalloprotease [Gammaproteobacteria bacterium]
MRSHIIGQAERESYSCFTYFQKIMPWYTGLLLILVTMLTPVSKAANLPLISIQNSAGMSIEDEYRFGNLIAGSIHKQLPLWHDLAALEFISDLTQPLVSRSQLSNKNIQLFIIHDSNINAFAAPGGIIAVNTGLIRQSGSVDELVAVLSHEVAHLSLRHYVQTLAQEQAIAPLYLGAVIASIWLAGNVNGDIGEAGFYATQTALQRSQLSYSRVHEREADRIGFDLMNRSPFDVAQMKTLLERLQSPYVAESPHWEWARSHPINNERVADIGQRISSIQAYHKKHGFELGFSLLKIHQAISLSSTPLPTVEKLLQGSDPLHEHYSTLREFSQALLNKRNGNLTLASKQLQKLSLKHPNSQLIWYRWMLSLLEEKKTKNVLKQLKVRQLQRQEDSLTLWVNALALRENNDISKATDQLLKLLDKQPMWILGWRTLAEWSAADNRFQMYHMAQSQWHLMRGEAQLALKQANYAGQQKEDLQAGSVSVQRQKALDFLADQTEFN